MKKEVFIALKEIKDTATAVYGTHLAKHLDRYVYLFGVVKVPIATPPVIVDGSILQNTVATQIKLVQNKADQNLEDLTNTLKEIYPQVYADTTTGFKEPAVLEETERKNPYLVVIQSSNDLTTLHEWFGTYETRLAENMTVPALVVPSNYPWKPVGNILYVMDKESENADNVQFLVEMATSFQANITVVTIAADQDEAVNEKHQTAVTALCESQDFTAITFHRVFTKNATEAIDEIMLQTDADWLAFEHKDRSLLERVFSDYNTKHLILNSKKPVLVF